MAAVERNYTVEKGATFERIFSLKDGNGDPVDISSATFKSEWRAEMKETGVLIATPVITVTDGPNGVYTYTVSNVNTDAITYCGYYDIFMSLSGKWYKLQFGTITVAENVTAVP